MTSSRTPQTSNKTLILIAGAGHGAWCWNKIIPFLKAKGFNVIPLEVPGCGGDTDSLKNNLLANDANALVEAAARISGKVSLLGHSSGGIIISQAAELLGTGKIDKLIYLDAFLPLNGESVFSIAEKLGKRNQPSSVSTAPPSERFIFSEDMKMFKWNPAIVQELLYHDCSPQDISAAKEQLCWQSVATLATPVHLTDAIFGAISKYYILCTQAKDLDKSSLTADVRCKKVYPLSSGHSPYFSKPENLAEIIEAILFTE